MSQTKINQAREIPRFRSGDPIKAKEMNILADEVRRLSARMATPPTQLPSRRKTTPTATVGAGDPEMVGFVRFFSS